MLPNFLHCSVLSDFAVIAPVFEEKVRVLVSPLYNTPIISSKVD